MNKEPVKYRVSVLLSYSVPIKKYNLSIQNKIFEIIFFNTSNSTDKGYCDLIITDYKFKKLKSSKLKREQKNTHGTVVIFSDLISPIEEGEYEKFFNKAKLIKFKKNKKLNEKGLKKLINTELIKQNVIDGGLKNFSFTFSKYTWKDILFEYTQLLWLLIPIMSIIVYFGIHSSNKSFSIINFLSETNSIPETKKEIAFFIIFYSVFNLIFFYEYILSFFDNLNNDIFISKVHLWFHKILHSLIPIIFFTSTLIIVKELYVLVFSDDISAVEKTSIEAVFNRTIPLINIKYLIFTFFILDLLLWLIVKNFFHQLNKININYISNKQKTILEKGKNSFKSSIIWDLIIYLGFPIVLSISTVSEFDMIILQLVFLQLIYLYLNITSIVEDFKYK